MFKVGETVGLTKFKNAYDKYASRVLGHLIEDATDYSGKRTVRKVKIIGTLPSREEYQEMKIVRYTISTDTVSDDARSEIEELANEMRDWYDNMPESLQQSDRGSRVEEAADALEGLEVPDAPEVCQHINYVLLPVLDTRSRSKRANSCADMMETAANAIEEWIEENRDEEDPDKPMTFNAEGEEISLEVDWDELETFVSDLREVAEQLLEIDFPGMYD